jgi:hypothetical protein
VNTKSLYDLFETDDNLESKGIALKFGPATFFCKRAGGANTAFDAAFEAKTRNMSSRLQLSALSNEQSDAILREVYAESVVTGWEGVTDREGKPLEFSVSNFVQVMKDLPTLWKALRTEAANHENFLRAQAKQEGTRLGN